MQNLVTSSSTASQICDLVGQSSFRIWQMNEFREPLNFDQLDQTEQDRIFNELIAAGICLARLQVESLGPGHFPPHLDEAIAKAYPDQLLSLEVPEQLVDIWRLLIDLRQNEYAEELGKESTRDEDLETELAAMSISKESAHRIRTVSFGALYHITRGEYIPEPPVAAMMTMWAIELDLEISKILKSAIQFPASL